MGIQVQDMSKIDEWKLKETDASSEGLYASQCVHPHAGASWLKASRPRSCAPRDSRWSAHKRSMAERRSDDQEVVFSQTLTNNLRVVPLLHHTSQRRHQSERSWKLQAKTTRWIQRKNIWNLHMIYPKANGLIQTTFQLHSQEQQENTFDHPDLEKGVWLVPVSFCECTRYHHHGGWGPWHWSKRTWPKMGWMSENAAAVALLFDPGFNWLTNYPWFYYPRLIGRSQVWPVANIEAILSFWSTSSWSLKS